MMLITNTFKQISESVPVSDYVRYIGIQADRHGMINCPFHDDRNPSMKVDSRFHCFGCGEDGDVIDFVSGYYDISKSVAAEKIAEEFNLNVKPSECKTENEKKDKIDYRYIKQHILNYLISVEKELKRWQSDYAPKPEDEDPHFLFVTAVHNLGYVSYLIDTLSVCKTDEEINKFISEYGGEIIL